MPADRLLTTVLRVYQDPLNEGQINNVLGSTTSLLTTLSNPLNISLLTSQLLNAPAIWQRADSLAISLRIISIFNTAAITVRKFQLERPEKPYDAYQPRLGGGLSCDKWTKAVIQGADQRSPRWMHTLVIGGVLLGMESQGRRGLTSALRVKLEYALVTAANLALEESSGNILALNSTILALNHAFPLLSDSARAELNCDPLGIHASRTITSADGYHDVYFLEAIDYDVRQVSQNTFHWDPQSPSFLQLQIMASKPLILSMGPLARLTAFAIEHMKDPRHVLEVQDHLLAFTNSLLLKWRRNKLSEIDISEESAFLSPETMQKTYPVMWQVLKTAMFAIVVLLQATLGRTFIDHTLSSPQHAASTASKSLTMLRNIYFISARLGSNAFSAYTFVNMSSIDVLARFPTAALQFFKSICPSHAGTIPSHPLDRNLDLFYLNTIEHFTLLLNPSDSEALVATPASPYLNPTANAHLLEIFEAAHSAMLALLASPTNAEFTAKILPFYSESLFASFPTNLSPRQFRFAFRALIQISTPPNPLSLSDPLMAETLLELLHHRILCAPTSPLPPQVAVKSDADAQSLEQAPLLSEQAVLLLSFLDALPFVTLDVLEHWLPVAADLLNMIPDSTMREHCRARFWDLLEGGEMDVERSAVCVVWWNTRGGRAKVLYGTAVPQAGPWMSGALQAKDSRL